MSPVLPPPVEAYFTADATDSEAITDCFMENATVQDEGHTYHGLDAIKEWKTASSNKYTYTSEPYHCETQADQVIVISRVSGNFPGSPIDLRYFFGLEGDKIASLEIRL